MAEVSEFGHFSCPHKKRLFVQTCERTWYRNVDGDEYIFLHYEAPTLRVFRPQTIHNLFQLSASN